MVLWAIDPLNHTSETEHWLLSTLTRSGIAESSTLIDKIKEFYKVAALISVVADKSFHCSISLPMLGMVDFKTFDNLWL